VSVAVLVAEELARRLGGSVVRRRDGFVLVHAVVGGRRVLLWVRGSPVGDKALRYLARVVRRIPHDEVWLVRLYRDPDYVDDYGRLVARVVSREELLGLQL